MPQSRTQTLPVISTAGLAAIDSPAARTAAAAIGAACRAHGFFYVRDHGVSRPLQDRLESLSRRFFALPLADKQRLAMVHGGRAWRGYFGVGDELTSGKPDLKEGLYFGRELGPEHPLVQAGTPLHGANLYPDLPEFKATLLSYIDALTQLGHRLMRGIALSLDLEPEYFASRYTADPLVLFRIFHYPPEPAAASHQQLDADRTPQWGVGEHTDYGILTILKQDTLGGLQVKVQGQWVEAPPMPDTFVCNIGDMLDRMTGGLYRSTPHRVRNSSGQGRFSFPFFFDPNFQAKVQPITGLDQPSDDAAERWDKSSVHSFSGTYGDYIMGKIGKVFPELKTKVVSPGDPQT